MRAGKRRTYFFDVRRTKGEDYYLTLTESTKNFNGGYERHKIFLYKEDFNRFIQSLEETIQHIKTELMPQYDYDEFARRQEEFEARNVAEDDRERPMAETPSPSPSHSTSIAAVLPVAVPVKASKPLEEEDDMSW
ncbi:MAG: hypothetical protein RLZZ628_569 [Bacteroidota bacterium]